MNDKKSILIASATLVLVICISAIVFVTELSKDALPECTYNITEEQRKMSTYDLLKWFCETEYMTELHGKQIERWVSSQIQTEPMPPCTDHQAYYELIRRDDLRDAYWQLESADDCPGALFLLTYEDEFTDIVGTEE